MSDANEQQTETKYTDEHMRLVREFQKLTGVDKLPEMTSLESEMRFRKGLLGEGDEPLADEEIPSNFKKILELSKEAHTKDRHILVYMIEQVVASMFTEDEMRVLVAFASSGVGQRVVEMQGLHVPNCSGACNAWSMEVLKRFCASEEFKTLANAIEPDEPSAMPAKELEAGTSISETQPQP